MNQLINDIFGDTHITLNCKAGECLRRSDVPGFVVRARRRAPFGAEVGMRD